MEEPDAPPVNEVVPDVAERPERPVTVAAGVAPLSITFAKPELWLLVIPNDPKQSPGWQSTQLIELGRIVPKSFWPDIPQVWEESPQTELCCEIVEHVGILPQDVLGVFAIEPAVKRRSDGCALAAPAEINTAAIAAAKPGVRVNIMITLLSLAVS